MYLDTKKITLGDLMGLRNCPISSRGGRHVIFLGRDGSGVNVRR